jgi:hypothetical protein
MPTNQTAKTDAADLASLFPSPETIIIRGEPIEVHPLTIRQLGKVAAALKRVADDPDLVEFDIAAIAASHTEDAIEAVAAAIGKPVDWVAALNSADFLALGLIVWNVNADFFGRHVAPLVEKIRGATATLGDGRTLSPSFTAPASATPAA